MAKADERASQYVFVEDEDIFEEDEKRLASRKREVGGISVPFGTLVKSASVSVIKKPNPIAARFHQDPLVVQRDAAKLHRAVKLLSSIPPPPSSTNPQFTLHNIIDLYSRHKNTSELKSKWKPGLVEEKFGYDVYLNTNNYVEELEHLRQKLTERFVSYETASHLMYSSPSLSEHEKELQRRNGMLKSSISQVSNISQRKSFFSQFSNSNVRTIVYDNNRKSSFLKSLPDSKANSKSHGNYRALFQNPKKQSANAPLPAASSVSSSYYSSVPSNYSIPSTASSTSSTSSTPSRCLLTGSVSSRSEKLVSSASRPVDTGVKKSCHKNLKFDEPLQSDKGVKKPKKLSQLHGKKMLWAVETLLKSEGVVNTDLEYKTLYANIYRETTQVWLKYCEKRENGKFRDSATGTSDLMVNAAKKLLPGIEQKLGISCSSVKAKKEAAKKSVDVSKSTLRSENVCRTSESASYGNAPFGVGIQIKEQNESFTSGGEGNAFSPDMHGVSSNMREKIDAVISSLDDLQPDPGEKTIIMETKTLNTLPAIVPSVSTHSEDNLLPWSTGINDLINPLLNSTLPALSLPTSTAPKNQFTGSYNLDCSTINKMTTLLTCPNDVSSSISSSQQNQSINVTTSSTSESSLIKESKSKSNIAETDKIEQVICSVTDICPDIVDVPDSNKITKEEDVSKTAVEADGNSERNINADKIPVCVVKLERCAIATDSENAKTPEQFVFSAGGSKSSSSRTSATLLVDTKVSSVKKNVSVDKLHDEMSPGKLCVESGRRKSKRKRNSDVSSNENTPTSSTSKSRSGKKLCFNRSSETNELKGNNGTVEHPSGSLRKSSRNKLTFDYREETSLDPDDYGKAEFTEVITSCQTEEEPIVQNKNLDNVKPCKNQNSSFTGEESSADHNDIVVTSKVVESTAVAVIQQGESSTSVITDSSPKNIDKENDSSMENISDVDNQNWSPILKFKRSSKHLWSSELKKKRIPSSRHKIGNSENSPVRSPFLDLEGPFKYRFCKRARPGEFVSAVIRGEMYSKLYKKLVKKNDITKDCVLVRTVKEGLELRIPRELLKKEPIFFGPNGFQNMISDIVEDAICKLEGYESDTAFNGFTLHDVNQAAMTSSMMERTLKVIEQTGEVVKPLFTMYKYAIVKQSPQNFKDFYQIFVEILKTSLFLRKSMVDYDTIQVRPLKTESPKKIQLEINIPVNLIGKNNRFKENILKDLTPVHNIISC